MRSSRAQDERETTGVGPSGRAAATPRRSSRTLLYLSGGLAIALSLSFAAQRLARADEDQRLATLFAADARERGLAVRHAYERAAEELQAMEELFDAVGGVDRASFQAVAGGLAARDPAVEALAYAPIVRADERREFVQRARREGADDFQIFERDEAGDPRRVQPRPRWVPVYLYAPAEQGAGRVGLDLASDPDLARGLALAEEHGGAWMLRRRAEGGHSRLEVALPLRAGRGDPGRTCTGFLWVQLREDLLLDRALMDLEPDRLLVRLCALHDEGEGPSLVVHGRTAWEAGYPARDFEASLVEHFDFTIFGIELRVRVSPGPGFLADHYSVWPDLAFVGVSVLCLLAIASLRLLFERTRRVEELAETRSLALEEHRAELERQVRAHELVENQSMRGKFVLRDFLVRMGHELRLPMSNLLGYAEMLEEPGLDAADRAEMLEVLERSSRHVLSLLADLIDLARLEVGEPIVQCAPCMPRPILREVGNYQALRAAARGVELDLGLGRSLPETIVTDATRLRQVLMNLVGAAVDLARDGIVLVRVGHEESRGLLVVVETQDRGFDAQALSRAFGDRHGVDDRLVTELGGTTLSLLLCGQLVPALGGRIDVAPAGPGRCRFVVELPLAPVAGDRSLFAPDEGEAGAGWTAPVEVEPQALAGKRILVAEDAPDARRLIERLLQRAGARVHCAVDGREAVDVLTREGRRYALVVMDLQMPRLDGLAAIQALRAGGFDRPILVLTAYADRDEERRCFAAGCDAYLVKPVDSRRLIAESVSLLRRTTA
ncbi:MAG: response regulator [Planctomycetota bacterium]